MNCIIGNGYVAKYFAELDSIKKKFILLSRNEINYYDKNVLGNYLKNNSINRLINCAGYTGKPNVDACEVEGRMFIRERSIARDHPRGL